MYISIFYSFLFSFCVNAERFLKVPLCLHNDSKSSRPYRRPSARVVGIAVALARIIAPMGVSALNEGLVRCIAGV